MNKQILQQDLEKASKSLLDSLTEQAATQEKFANAVQITNTNTSILKTMKFLQYHHVGSCKTPCADCPPRDKRVFLYGEHIKLPAHPHCDCKYSNVEIKPLGTISKMGLLSPDVFLKAHGRLPDYYILKAVAETVYGWNSRRNKMSGKAPGKMIGGDVYQNKDHILPEKEGRIWYECDVDYESGTRKSDRLYYSNDGLMFYSTDHLFGNVTIYQIK